MKIYIDNKFQMKIQSICNLTRKLQFNLTEEDRVLKIIYFRHLLDEDITGWKNPKNIGFKLSWVQLDQDGSKLVPSNDFQNDFRNKQFKTFVELMKEKAKQGIMEDQIQNTLNLLKTNLLLDQHNVKLQTHDTY